MWASIVAAVVIVLAGVAVLVVMLLRDRDTEQASDTTVIVSSTATTRPLTSTTERVTTTEAPSTTSSSTTVFAGPPGDSPGQWVEQEIPDFPGEMWSAAISDEVLVVRTQSGDKPELYAYLLQSGDIVRLPIDYTEVWSVSVSGSLVVWWEGEFDPNTYQRKEAHVYAFSLPSGPKVEVATGVRGAAYYPQVAWPWVTWAEEQSWPENPEEYFEETIYGVQVDQQGNPTGNPAELVGSALAFAMGDAVWIYSVSSTHLAWENATPQEGLAGTYIMDLATFTPRKIGQNAWRPSLAEGVLVYWEDGLHWADPQRLQPTLLDPNGDFPTAAPTYAAYYRYPPDSPGGQYEVVARGYSGAHEQVLATTSVAPHFSAPIAAAGSYLAVALDEGLRLFRWQPEGAK
ncbi:MAG: hypothetical protein N3B14_00545 [Thermoleophilia bacterium]|nr:hypothetical protein [Thermoleophilia bacterium]